MVQPVMAEAFFSLINGVLPIAAVTSRLMSIFPVKRPQKAVCPDRTCPLARDQASVSAASRTQPGFSNA
jgi:hypothetical protein